MSLLRIHFMNGLKTNLVYVTCIENGVESGPRCVKGYRASGLVANIV